MTENMDKQDKVNIPQEILDRLPAKQRANSKVNITKAIQLRVNGMTYTDIGKYFGVTKQAVLEQVRRYLPKDIDIKATSENLSPIMRGKAYELLLSLSDDDQKAMSGLQKSTAFCQLYDKVRLEEGKSTQNIDIRALTGSIEEMEAEERRIQEELEGI